MKWFRIMSGLGTLIDTVEVERESEDSIWVVSSKSVRRTRIHTRFFQHFRTWEEARQELLTRAQSTLTHYEAKIPEMRTLVERLKALTP